MMNESQRQIMYFVRPCFISDFRVTFTEVAQAGIKHIVLASNMGELNLNKPKDCSKAKSILDSLGLETPACHGLLGSGGDFNFPEEDGRKCLLANHKQFLTNMSSLGCLTYVVHPGQRLEGYQASFLWDRVREALDELLPFAESLGIVIALENSNPGHLGDDSKELVSFVSEYSSPSLRLCFDSGHAHRSENVLETFSNMEPYLATVHLHDNDRSADQHLIPGFGTIPWDELIPLIKSSSNLRHIETEAFNIEKWEHAKLYEHYCRKIYGNN